MKLDLRDFKITLEKKSKAVRAGMVGTLNGVLKTVANGVARAIPPVSPSRIRSDLTRDPHILAALTSQRLAKKGIGILALPRFKSAMNRFLRFKIASSGYMCSPFAQIADMRSKGFLGITVERSLATRNGLRAELRFTMSHETGEKKRTAEQRFKRELTPILKDALQGLEDRIKGWK